MPPEDFAKQFFALGREIGEQVKRSIDKLDADSGEEFAYRGSIFFFFCKTYKTFQAIEVLWPAGFPEDIAMLNRSLFEIVAQAAYMTKDPSTLTRRYAEFGIVERMRLYERVKRSGDAALIASLEADGEFLDNLKENFKKIQTKHSGPTWWGESLEWLAHETELDGLYRTVVWDQMGLTHSSSRAMNAYVSGDESGLLAQCGPTTCSWEAAMHAAWAMILIVDKVTVAFGVPSEEQSSGWRERYVAITKQASATDPRDQAA